MRYLDPSHLKKAVQSGHISERAATVVLAKHMAAQRHPNQEYLAEREAIKHQLAGHHPGFNPVHVAQEALSAVGMGGLAHPIRRLHNPGGDEMFPFGGDGPSLVALLPKGLSREGAANWFMKRGISHAELVKQLEAESGKPLDVFEKSILRVHSPGAAASNVVGKAISKMGRGGMSGPKNLGDLQKLDQRNQMWNRFHNSNLRPMPDDMGGVPSPKRPRAVHPNAMKNIPINSEAHFLLDRRIDYSGGRNEIPDQHGDVVGELLRRVGPGGSRLPHIQNYSAQLKLLQSRYKTQEQRAFSEDPNIMELPGGRISGNRLEHLTNARLGMFRDMGPQQRPRGGYSIGEDLAKRVTPKEYHQEIDLKRQQLMKIPKRRRPTSDSRIKQYFGPTFDPHHERDVGLRDMLDTYNMMDGKLAREPWIEPGSKNQIYNLLGIPNPGHRSFPLPTLLRLAKKNAYLRRN